MLFSSYDDKIVKDSIVKIKSWLLLAVYNFTINFMNRSDKSNGELDLLLSGVFFNILLFVNRLMVYKLSKLIWSLLEMKFIIE